MCIKNNKFYFTFFKGKKILITNNSFKTINTIQLNNLPKGLYINGNICYILFPKEKKLGIFNILFDSAENIKFLNFPDGYPFYMIGLKDKIFMINEVGNTPNIKYLSYFGYLVENELRYIYDGEKNLQIDGVYLDESFVSIFNKDRNEIQMFELDSLELVNLIKLSVEITGAGFFKEGFFYLFDYEWNILKLDLEGTIVFKFRMFNTPPYLIKGGVWTPFVENEGNYHVLDSRNRCIIKINVDKL